MDTFAFAAEVLGSVADLRPPFRAPLIARILSGFRICPATSYCDVFGPFGTRFILAETPDGWDAVDSTDDVNVLVKNVPLPIAVNAIAFRLGLSTSSGYLPGYLWPTPNAADRKG